MKLDRELFLFGPLEQLSRRHALAATVLFPLAALAILGEAYLTRIFFFIPFYWIGFTVFLLIGSVPYSARSDRVFDLALLGFAAVLLVIYLLQNYPEAVIFGLGFPGFIIGLASRFALASLRKSK